LFLGTKEGPPQGDENMVGELRAWVEGARFTAAPDWVATYARDQLEELFGP
jgi:hypothetical protein